MREFTKYFGRANGVEQAPASLPYFEKHTKEWFLNRVGELVERSYTVFTPAQEKSTTPTLNKMAIADERHAEACYEYHISKKVNFYETSIKTK